MSSSAPSGPRRWTLPASAFARARAWAAMVQPGVGVVLDLDLVPDARSVEIDRSGIVRVDISLFTQSWYIRILIGQGALDARPRRVEGGLGHRDGVDDDVVGTLRIAQVHSRLSMPCSVGLVAVPVEPAARWAIDTTVASPISRHGSAAAEATGPTAVGDPEPAAAGCAEEHPATMPARTRADTPAVTIGLIAPVSGGADVVVQPRADSRCRKRRTGECRDSPSPCRAAAWQGVYPCQA